MQVSLSVKRRQEASVSRVLSTIPLYRKSYKKADSLEKVEPGQKVRTICHYCQSKKGKKCKRQPQTAIGI